MPHYEPHVEPLRQTKILHGMDELLIAGDLKLSKKVSNESNLVAAYS